MPERKIAVKDAVLRIQDGDRAARRIRGRRGGNNKHGQPGKMRHSLCKIECFPSADAGDDVTPRRAQLCNHAVDILPAALALYSLHPQWDIFPHKGIF